MSTNGKRYHSYQGTISMTQEHAEPVEAVLGLDNHPVAKPHFRIYDNKKKKKPTPPGHKPTPPPPAQTGSFNPPQVAQLYGFPTGVNGAGQTIGIIELGGGYNASDLSAYFSGLGIVEPKVTAISVDGGANSPGDPNGADGEVALDIEVAGSIAPGANIAVYFTTNTSQGFLDALTTALHDTSNGPPSVISISWGSEESNYTAQTLTAFDEACQSAAALGITITVASGDNGSTDGGTGNNVDFPASSPHVLGCGGTDSDRLRHAISSGESSGTISPRAERAAAASARSSHCPTWQANAKVPAAPTSAGGRGVPDVAGDASPETGYNVSFDGQNEVVGGTSAVAPLWAALIALLNQQRGSNLGFINPTIYQNAEERLQRHHPGKQRRLAGRPRLGPVHRARFAKRPPTGDLSRLVDREHLRKSSAFAGSLPCQATRAHRRLAKDCTPQFGCSIFAQVYRTKMENLRPPCLHRIRCGPGMFRPISDMLPANSDGSSRLLP